MITIRLLMCPAHWATVPHTLRRQVYVTYNHWRRAPNAETAEAYRMARTAAINSLAVKKKRPE